MIHQFLHGYANGHDLLASSVTLSREQRILLSQATDLSGPAPVRGFDGYLTGFPLTGEGYILSRTWYATELPRPGCVWTHSLLLSSDALSRNSILSLRDLFRRPERPDRFDEYAKEIVEPDQSKDSERPSSNQIAVTMGELYGDAKVRVCIATESSAEIEDDFLAIWNQQWPELRREFSFTTGMLGRGTRPFDLQAIPSKNKRLFQDSSGFTIIDKESEVVQAPWVTKASTDAMVNDRPSALRQFLWTFGKDFHYGRQSYRGLCEVFHALSAATPTERALAAYECLAKFFDDSSESSPLKAAIFGGQGGRWAVDELNSLEIIARDDLIGVIEISESRLRQRCALIPIGQFEELILRLADGWNGDRVRIIAEVFFERCDARNLLQLPLDIVAEAIVKRTDLSRDVVTWRRGEEFAFGLLKELIARNALTSDVVFGLLNHGNLRLLYEAENETGKISNQAWVRGVRDFTEKFQPQRDIEDFIIRRLWNSRHELLDELLVERFGRFVKYAAAVLDISQRQAILFPLENTIPQSELPRFHDQHSELQACGFLLMVGLVRAETIACQFMVEGFSPIYQAAKNQTLPLDLWRRLEHQLPWHFLDWDRCERLIEGAVNRFVERSWSPKGFFKTFATYEEFDRAVSLLVSRGQQEYIQRLRNEAPLGVLSGFQSDRLFRL